MTKTLTFKVIMCLLVPLLLSGCLGGGTEINDLEIVVGMGVDKDKDTGKILLTAQIVREGEIGSNSGNGGGQNAKAFWNVTATGDTIFDAIREMTHKTGNRLFVSHNHVVIYGYNIAEEGLQEHIDFFLRSHEMRPTAFILIAECDVSAVLDAKPETEELPAMNIAKLLKSHGYTSHFIEVNLKDFISCLMSPTTSPVAPIVEVTPGEESEDIYISGMAIFKNDKMVGKLNKEETRGLLWVKGKIKSGVLLVPSPGKQGKIALEILEAKTKVTPKMENGKIVMDVNIKVDTSLAEQATIENMTTLPGFEKMQKIQEEVIKHEIMAAFEKSKELKADIFGFGEMLHKKYSSKWNAIKDNWDDIYPDIVLNIDVKAEIKKADLLVKAPAPG